jgi:Leu/Phe-tRNA-protein transferase
MPVYLLSDDLIFPAPQLASEEGLLAVGGDLSQERLLLAYRMGIFPWYSEDEPVMWWSPDPRLVLYPAELKVSKSLEKTIKKRHFEVTMDQAFESVIKESMFTRISNASKVAFVALVEHLKALNFNLIDCQITTAHLISFGAREISRARFLDDLKISLKSPTIKGKWSVSTQFSSD